MAIASLCAAPDCDKAAKNRGKYCSMHEARLRRGGTLEPRQPRKTISELLNHRDQFGMWSIVGEGSPYRRPTPNGSKHRDGVQRTAHCRCICGITRDIPIHTLKQGHSKHCGCMVPAMNAAQKTRHGMSYTAEHRCWCKIKERCHNPKSKDWPDYGGRGISVCAEWLSSFEAFFAHIGPKPDPTYSIDRIDVNGNYEPGNVRWADAVTQSRNRRPRHNNRP